MKADLVYIIPDTISFGALKRCEVTPTHIYRAQTRAWILQPVTALEQQKPSAPANGMAAFAILLMFFEAHGQYVLGNDIERQSKKCFCTGFKRFAESVVDGSLGAVPDEADLYRWARCGLFHSAKLANELLIDTINCGSGIFTRKETVAATLVNPWRMKKHLESYIEKYCEEIEVKPQSDLAANFGKTFDRLVRKPMEHFCG